MKWRRSTCQDLSAVIRSILYRMPTLQQSSTRLLLVLLFIARINIYLKKMLKSLTLFTLWCVFLNINMQQFYLFKLVRLTDVGQIISVAFGAKWLISQLSRQYSMMVAKTELTKNIVKCIGMTSMQLNYHLKYRNSIKEVLFTDYIKTLRNNSHLRKSVFNLNLMRTVNPHNYERRDG